MPNSKPARAQTNHPQGIGHPQRDGIGHSINGLKTVVVQKYGGATLSDPAKIQQVAKRISSLSKSGTSVVAVVSAMGSTTNQLIDLAGKVSRHPNRREMDMLLSTGERVSQALLSMALHDQGVNAISFTGSQAGILTDESHVSAQIKDVKAFRVSESLDADKVVVLAGFQGVSPVTKEITTLGRGGSDTTAVAIAAYLKANQCEILKDVDAVLTCDPKLSKKAKPLRQLHYKHLLEMTFWGAKVLHYRSVELAMSAKVPLYIGPSVNQKASGTWVKEENQAMFETQKVLAINSHEQVLALEVGSDHLGRAVTLLESSFEKNEIPHPQFLHFQQGTGHVVAYLTGPREVLQAIEKEFPRLGIGHAAAKNSAKHPNSKKKSPTAEANKNGSASISIQDVDLCSVSVTHTGSTSIESVKKCLNALDKKKIPVVTSHLGAMTLSLFLHKKDREKAIQALHELI